MPPLVTVVTPFLNVAPFLGECIESVLAQTFTNWELILVDDGSTDMSTAIAHQYEARHPKKIRVVEHPGRVNRGISASRNLGCRHAGGRWIASLDADDVWLPDKLAEQLEILERHPEVGMIVGASKYWYGWSGHNEDINKDRIVQIGVPPDSVIFPPQLLHVLYPLGSGAAPCPTSAVVRADVTQRLGGWEESSTNAYEDQYFFCKVYLDTTVYVSGKCWDFYRRRADSAMTSAFSAGGYHAHRQRFLEWLESYLDGKSCADALVWRSLRRALRRYRHPWVHRAESILRRVAGRIHRMTASQ